MKRRNMQLACTRKLDDTQTNYMNQQQLQIHIYPKWEDPKWGNAYPVKQLEDPNLNKGQMRIWGIRCSSQLLQLTHKVSQFVNKVYGIPIMQREDPNFKNEGNPMGEAVALSVPVEFLQLTNENFWSFQPLYETNKIRVIR